MIGIGGQEVSRSSRFDDAEHASGQRRMRCGTTDGRRAGALTNSSWMATLIGSSELRAGAGSGSKMNSAAPRSAAVGLLRRTACGTAVESVPTRGEDGAGYSPAAGRSEQLSPFPLVCWRCHPVGDEDCRGCAWSASADTGQTGLGRLRRRRHRLRSCGSPNFRSFLAIIVCDDLSRAASLRLEG